MDENIFHQYINISLLLIAPIPLPPSLNTHTESVKNLDPAVNKCSELIIKTLKLYQP